MTPLMQRALLDLAGRTEPVARGQVEHALGLSRRGLVTPFAKLGEEGLIETPDKRGDGWQITEKGLAYAVHGIDDVPEAVIARHQAFVDARERALADAQPAARAASRQAAAERREFEIHAAAARDGDLTEADLQSIMVMLPVSRLGTMAEYVARMVIEIRRRRDAVATQEPVAYQVIGIAGNELLTTPTLDVAEDRARAARSHPTPPGCPDVTIRPLYAAASLGPDDSPLMEELQRHRERIEAARLGAIEAQEPGSEDVGPTKPWDQAELEAFAEEVTLLDGTQVAMFQGASVASLACEVLRGRRALADMALRPPPPAVAVLDSVLTWTVIAHPMPWTIEDGWTVEVTAADGVTIAKCRTFDEANAVIAEAQLVAKRLADARTEVAALIDATDP